MKIPDRNPRRFKYAWISDTLREQIRTGIHMPGAQLPPLRELADRFGVNVGTVREGLRPLIEDGTVVAVQGMGHFVADLPQTPGGPDLATAVHQLTERVNALEQAVRGQSSA